MPFIPVTKKATLTADLGPLYAGSTIIGYTLYNGDGSTYQARTHAGVTEAGTATGKYRVELGTAVFPNAFDGYVLWDSGGTAILAIEDVFATDRFSVIQAKTDLIGAGAALLVIGAFVNGDRLQIIQGDDYNSAAGTQISLTIQGVPDLTGFDSLSFTIGSTTFVPTAASATTMTLQLTAAQTTALTAGQTGWALAGLKSTRRQTLARGPALIVPAT